MVSKQLSRTQGPTLVAGTALPEPRPLAPFKLIDQSGAAFTQAQLIGAPSLLFFGFTHCPDVCPSTLALMAQLGREPALGSLRIVFVTVDPQRDDQAAMQQYVSAFGQGMTGLTGSEDALSPLLSTLGVVHAIQPLAGDQYTVDHSATVYYLNDKGQFAAVFTPPFDYANMRADLSTLLASGF